MSYEDIFTIMEQIQEWLIEYVPGTDKDNHMWSDKNITIPLWRSNGERVDVPCILRFRFEEDLLAFKIKFGIS